MARTLPKNFYLTSLTAATILEPGEDLTSERVIREVGPFAISSVHYIYDKLKENGGEPPPHMRPFWKEYCALVEQTPARARHLRVHAGHCTYLLPEESKFVTPELIRSTCLAGTADEVIDSSGNGNHGVATNSVTTIAGGKLGRGVDFSSVSVNGITIAFVEYLFPETSIFKAGMVNLPWCLGKRTKLNFFSLRYTNLPLSILDLPPPVLNLLRICQSFKIGKSISDKILLSEIIEIVYVMDSSAAILDADNAVSIFFTPVKAKLVVIKKRIIE